MVHKWESVAPSTSLNTTCLLFRDDSFAYWKFNEQSWSVSWWQLLCLFTRFALPVFLRNLGHLEVPWGKTKCIYYRDLAIDDTTDCLYLNGSWPKSKSLPSHAADFFISWQLWTVSNSVWYTHKGCWSWIRNSPLPGKQFFMATLKKWYHLPIPTLFPKLLYKTITNT